MTKGTVAGTWLVLFTCGMSIACCGAICAQTRSGATADVAVVSHNVRTPKVAQIVWFSGKKSRGLRQDSAGNLIVSRKKLALEKPVARLHAAAYYPGVEVLITVDENAVTSLYERTGKFLKLKQTRPPHSDAKRERIKPIEVRFCNIPGLVYLTWVYPQLQSYNAAIRSVYSERLALGSRARNWHAVTTTRPGVKFLEYTYRIPSGRSLHLFMSDGKRITVQLPGQLAKTLDSDQLHYIQYEPVFVLPGRAIICKTCNGWSMHNLNGNLISYFPCGHLGNRFWTEPVYKNGHFYVVQKAKPSSYYRMDVPKGRLVYVGDKLLG